MTEKTRKRGAPTETTVRCRALTRIERAKVRLLDLDAAAAAYAEKIAERRAEAMTELEQAERAYLDAGGELPGWDKGGKPRASDPRETVEPQTIPLLTGGKR